jgi:hypothetical protein
MAIEARLRELGVRHQLLERAIQDEMAHPAFDDDRIKEMKRQKLRLKEEMESLKTKAL